MDFTQLVADLKMLEGLTLSSIRPGAELVIEKVDVEQGKILITSKNKRVQSRPLSEFQKLWDELCNAPAIHVDEVLHGSGSSRNQPETILANLPYIEWLKINNKKHIAYVYKPTHAFGTIKRMDNSLAAEVSSKYLAAATKDCPLIFVVAKDIALTADLLSNQFGKRPQAISEGIYECLLAGMRIILTSEGKAGIACGTYCEIRAKNIKHFENVLCVNGAQWGVYKLGDLVAVAPL